MLVWGFSILMLISLISIIALRIRNKNNKSAYNLFIAHFIIFTFAGIALLKAMRVNSNTHQTMASEFASLWLGLARILWAFSIICLLVGMAKINTGNKQ